MLALTRDLLDVTRPRDWTKILTPEVTARFRRRFVRRGATSCWLWIGCPTQSYGVISVNGRLLGAHRFAFALAYGGAEADRHEMIRHTCDNGRCVNPAHLVGGTHADNMRDKVARGRTARPQGVKHPNARLSEQNVRAIRRALARGESARAVAGRFGVSRSAVTAIGRRTRWVHL